MTTKQLAAKVRRLYRENGNMFLTNFRVSRNQDGKGDMIAVNYTCMDEGQIGITCDKGKWFIPVEELTYSELKYIVNAYEKTIK